MLNIISSEIYKMKRNWVFLICGLLTIAMPVLIIMKDINLKSSVIPYLDAKGWAMSSIQMSILLLLPVLSGFVITTIMQREYTEHTIINNLTAPVSRIGFISGKIVVWFLWHMMVAMICWLIILFGSMLFYSDTLKASERIQFTLGTFKMCLKISLFSFLAMMPTLSMAVVQRRLFYPSLLLCLFLTFITSFTSQMPEWLVFKLPWTAVAVQLLMDNPPLCSLVPIVTCGILSFIVTYGCIRRQDL